MLRFPSQPSHAAGRALWRAALVAVLLQVCSRSAQAQYLYVGDDAGSILRYSATTGAFVDVFATVPRPRGMTFGPDGSLFVTSDPGDALYHFDVRTGAPLIGGTFAVSGGVTGVAYAPDGLLYTSRYKTVGDDGPVRRVDPLDPSQSVLLCDVFEANNVTLGPAPDFDLFVSSFGGRSVSRVSRTSGQVVAETSNLGGLGYGSTVGPDGLLYAVAAGTPSSIMRFDASVLGSGSTFIAPGPASGGLSVAYDVKFGPDGSLYVSSASTHSVKRYNGATGAYLDDFVAPGSGGLDSPIFIAFDPASLGKGGPAQITARLDKNGSKIHTCPPSGLRLKVPIGRPSRQPGGGRRR